MTDPAPRLLESSDVPAAMRLKESAGWNQTEADWFRILALAPEGAFAIDCNNTLAATATAVCYGSELSWIGMVLTLPEFRGRGFARRLMEHAICFALARTGRVKLDATGMGAPLYAKLGFTPECAIERWARPPGTIRMRESLRGGSPDLALDREAFGADRGPLLTSLAAEGCVAIPGEGYAMGRAGSQAAYFGPCVSRSPAAARHMLEWFLAAHPDETVYWDLLPENEPAAEIARNYGFQPLRKLVRMQSATVGTPPLASNPALVFATAGFEYG